MPIDNPSSYVLAAGALGTAAFALVDTSKVMGGGISNCGFARIRTAIATLFPATATAPPLPRGQMIDVLRANWLNGTALADQKLIARSLMKLRMNADTAAGLARATGVDVTLLSAVAAKMASGEPLTPQEQNVLGRFDLGLTTLLDEAYQRADQIYRNSAKAASVVVSVVLAYLGGWAVVKGPFAGYWCSADAGLALLTGLAATPLAPIAKDLASALSAAKNAVGFQKK